MSKNTIAVKRPVVVLGDVAYIELTKGFVAVIDAVDVKAVAGFNWTALKKRNGVYAYRKDWSTGTEKTVQLHRVLLDAPDELHVDHIDGDGLNNRRSNLRLATRSQNNHNQRLTRQNKSGLKGVSWSKDRGKWLAQIKINGKQNNLGRFDTPQEAHAAYCAASAKLHGEFGRTA